MLLVTLVVAVQYSFWGNYLPRVFPLHLRGTGESFAMSIGGRVLAPFAALATTQLSNVMPGANPTLKLAHSMALVAVVAIAVRACSLSRWLPEPARRTPGGLTMSAASTYLLDNASEKAGTRMDVLARLFDADHAPRARRRRDSRPDGAAWKSAAAAAAWRAGWRSASGPQGTCCAPTSTRASSSRDARPRPRISK